jgi:GDP-4-dehydro-6-deoxy-D-mannose reductase
MRALITGAEGFIGGHLIRHLKTLDYGVYASVENPKISGAVEADRLIKCDITVAEEVNDAVGISEPDVIYHLAAQSYPTLSWDDPAHTIKVNVLGTTNLFESILKHDINPIVIVACSSAEYGLVTKTEVPVTEDHKLQPLHPYGVSKVAQDLLTYQYYKNNGIRGVRARIFNTTGPGKVKDAVSDFAQRAALCEKGRLTEIVHGNLDAERDITDVRDQVRALQSLEGADFGQAYNLCSMQAHKIKDLLESLVKLTGGTAKTRADPKLMRPTDEPIILGDNTKIRKKTGWKPTIPIQKTLKDTLDHFRQST